MRLTQIAFLVQGLLATQVLGHGYLTSPAPRQKGEAYKSACGQQLFNADKAGNIQNYLQTAKGQKDFDPTKCNLQLCKGYQFADNKGSVQKYKPGQKVDMKADIVARHTGVANVSIVDTRTSTILGKPLLTWKDYAPNEHNVDANNTAFSVTIPADLEDGCVCQEAGDCVLQWWWDAHSIDQTYISCVDFVLA
jgi:hypothetical protein